MLFTPDDLLDICGLSPVGGKIFYVFSASDKFTADNLVKHTILGCTLPVHQKIKAILLSGQKLETHLLEPSVPRSEITRAEARIKLELRQKGCVIADFTQAAWDAHVKKLERAQMRQVDNHLISLARDDELVLDETYMQRYSENAFKRLLEEIDRFG